MISQAQQDVMLQIVGYAILLYLLVVALFHFARFARNLPFDKSTLNSMRWWRRGGGTTNEEADKIRERVVREVGETCSMLALTVAKAVMVMCIVTFLAMVRNIRSGQTRFTNFWQDLSFVVFTLATTIMATVPCLVRPKTLVIWYSILMICISLGVVSADSYEDAMYISSFWMLPRVALAVAHGQVVVATFWNIVCLSGSFYSYLDRSNTSKAQGIDNSFLNRRTLTIEIMYFCVVVFGTALAKRAMWAYVHSVVKTSTLSGERSAMKELLHLLCDVSVELDSELAFVEHDQKFAAYLTQEASREIKGRPFKEFIPDPSERDTFDDRVRSAVESSSQPGALHTSLRGGWGSHINVEVFFVQFDSGDMTKHYFVGCREFDNQPIANLRTSRQSNQQGADGQDTGMPLAVSQQSIEDDAASAKSAGSGSSRGSKNRLCELSVPQAQPTTMVAMQLSLVSLLKTWNVRHRAVFCCPLHAHLEWAQRVCRQLARGKCRQSFKPMGAGQCTICGILDPDEDEGECLSCGIGQLEAVAVRATASL